MTKDQLALKISLAMHKPPNARLDTFNEYLSTYQCLCNYFQELSMEDMAGIANQYSVKV
ncbi:MULTISPECIES: hypothetical protein [Prochlorococcus]|uniref:Uncharacterized protein n=1 Tax=Prochlorococcus marinus (strain SARG / CCMP1375 / SS120) TaxID=167539 RepID=Q7VCQ6_PROMA|nr:MULTISPECIES: hypothetical protein [Prochlorococcus]AAP99728.1 Predicted protein family PM-4 [Prochlorococcus marinus subsp. marinus str. CCMP1375]KGG14433.1 putative protein family PM-4 [Prochlorococcus marinus str. LG]KGG22577.1 putative protein family PM-4 [Prochlorococcus marinus str. SS2]KGG24420.1 putative protein family PM-4 [Prochlorococcus marinus str. SS35]KGG34193.1 putative protein family PM-4 [Prochlorococcus marinus str. SS51]